MEKPTQESNEKDLKSFIIGVLITLTGLSITAGASAVIKVNVLEAKVDLYLQAIQEFKSDVKDVKKDVSALALAKRSEN